MCNEIARRIALALVREDFSQLRIPLRFPEGAPNFAPLDSIRITDPAVIVRWADDAAEMVTRRWSWPGPNGKPVYNFRSDGRRLDTGRCLIPVDAFYEFTAPADPRQRRKDKWSFGHAAEPWFCLGGLWRKDATAGEAFTLLTCPPGPDVEPYHARQMIVVERRDWRGWLDGSASTADICLPLPAGTLKVTAVGR